MRLQDPQGLPWFVRPTRNQIPEPRHRYNPRHQTLLDPAFVPAPKTAEMMHLSGNPFEMSSDDERYRIRLRLDNGPMSSSARLLRDPIDSCPSLAIEDHISLTSVERIEGTLPQKLGPIITLEEKEALEENEEYQPDGSYQLNGGKQPNGEHRHNGDDQSDGGYHVNGDHGTSSYSHINGENHTNGEHRINGNRHINGDNRVNGDHQTNGYRQANRYHRLNGYSHINGENRMNGNYHINGDHQTNRGSQSNSEHQPHGQPPSNQIRLPSISEGMFRLVPQ
ncbi:hypothetical protein F4677DRAFT_210274 [Hypoxylon crocopeplum]|nr:hypothetical protein F4677DRAFT_210274 [Hypoxylon crocopeplum]